MAPGALTLRRLPGCAEPSRVCGAAEGADSEGGTQMSALQQCSASESWVCFLGV